MNSETMVASYLKGNLGNQLFIYAAARQIQARHFHDDPSCLLVLDDQRSVQINRLANFRLIPNLQYRPAPWPLRQKIARHFLYSRYLDDKIEYERPYELMGYTLGNRKALQRRGLILSEDCYIPVEDKLPNRVFLDGYFQSEKFFPDIREKLLKEIVPKEPPLSKNLELIRLLQSTESVCLTARMGYLKTDPQYGVSTVAYYQRAIELMKWLHPHCRFFLFADDVEAAKTKLTLPEDTVCEQGSDPDYEKLRVMSNSKHFILSNSSFSWWVRYLSVAPHQTVIAPNHWYSKPIPCDIFQNDWILLPTE